MMFQFYDLMELFKTGGEMPDTNYIFMVCIFLYIDYEIINYILVFKVKKTLFNTKIPLILVQYA